MRSKKLKVKDLLPRRAQRTLSLKGFSSRSHLHWRATQVLRASRFKYARHGQNKNSAQRLLSMRQLLITPHFLTYYLFTMGKSYRILRDNTSAPFRRRCRSLCRSRRRNPRWGGGCVFGCRCRVPTGRSVGSSRAPIRSYPPVTSGSSPSRAS